MTPTSSLVLLVDDDPTTLNHFQRVLEHEPALRIVTATNGKEGLAKARALVPDLIISDYQMPELDGFEFCRQVKADPTLSSCLFVVLSGFSDTALKVRGLNLGVDDYLTKPIEVPELIARVRSSLRIKRLQDQLRGDRLSMLRLHGELGRSFDQLIQLLIHLVDLARPGAADRGTRVAGLVADLAARFEVPSELLPDLDMAAKLHEIGLVVEASHQHGAGETLHDWRPAVVASTLLLQVERLSGAANLLRGIGEHWDGTGMPDHLVSGQIPLRSRLLRVALDFLWQVEGMGTAPGKQPTDAIEVLKAHQGTWYDPLAVVHLESVVLDRPREEWANTRIPMAVDQLRVGMVLAADLSTSSGVKLLSRDTTVTRSMLDVINRRHLADPILDGVWVKK
jgi:response regulator RpfG family c-di-GMP phosphodiesterase